MSLAAPGCRRFRIGWGTVSVPGTTPAAEWKRQPAKIRLRNKGSCRLLAELRWKEVQAWPSKLRGGNDKRNEEIPDAGCCALPGRHRNGDSSIGAGVWLGRARAADSPGYGGGIYDRNRRTKIQRSGATGSNFPLSPQSGRYVRCDFPFYS